MRSSPLLLAVVCALVSIPRLATAQSYDPPANYYATATGTGATLKSQLHDVIDNNTVISYDGARTALQVTDRDPNNANRILLVYNRVSNTAAWDNAATWNREHTWPESRLGSGGRAVSDLFNLRASTTQVNSDRGNLHFGGAFGQTFGVKSDGGTTVWYPGDADAGMIARQEFYMAVRYDGADSGTSDLELVSTGNTSTAARLGNLTRMIEWHYAAVPDSFERRRNQVIYDDYQHNRNPFTDRPEYVWSIFMNQTNDSSLSFQGGTNGADGSSALAVDMGRVIVGGAVPAAKSITLNKAGLNGTYYSVTTAGAATSTVSGRYNAFNTGVTGSRSINVGLTTSTAAAGLKTGTVTVDNLDVTTAGGAGRGGNDANDVATVNLSVLSHANPSFAAGNDANSLTYDFGTISLGGPAPTFAFSLFNLEATAGYTAGLDLDAILGSGDTAAFSTTLAPFQGAATLAAGAGYGFTASMNTLAPGAFSVTYSLNFSDENLSGATSLGSMSLTLSGVVSAAPVENADFNGDGFVDGADFLSWQRGFGGSASLATGDANGDGLVDAADLAIWQTQYGSGASPVAAVPEPAACCLALAAGLAVTAVRRRRAA
ncbi:endonuclease [Lacipirellula sp.]|uniref:endonuclease n=1 Tax=Lacipirellula sp. TaxID=2691419 RepID=UPI003D13888B